MNIDDQIDVNNYEIIQRIGCGTFAVVYIVKEKQTGHLYAAKIPLKPISEFQDGEKKDIERELSIMCKLNHPAILKMIGYCSKSFNNEDKPTIITEYLSNGTLGQILESERKNKHQDDWNDTTKLIALYGIASAMDYLHKNDIIHRDLKPSNILMDSKMHPRIGDFGVSKITKSNENSLNQSTVNTKGTPIYMPPELCEDNKYSSAGDVYAFGMIVYQIMTSQIPYSTYKNIHANKLSKLVTSGIRPDMDFPIADCYKELIEACWHQEESMRPKFSEILQELRNNTDFITEKVDHEKFFMIMYEVITSQIPFSSYKIRNAHKLSRTVISGTRPDMNFPIANCYKELIEACWHQDASMRPKFSEIVEELKNNSNFITRNVDREKYFEYIKYIDAYNV